MACRPPTWSLESAADDRSVPDASYSPGREAVLLTLPPTLSGNQNMTCGLAPLPASQAPEHDDTLLLAYYSKF